jgi:tRNA (guanine-N7-)-methyltransferase
MWRSAFTDLLGGHPLGLVDEGVYAWRGRWRSRFPGASHLVLDIGTWDAALIAQVAPMRKEVGFIGLDWRARPLFHAAQRLTETGAENVCLMQAQAREVGRIVGEGELDEIWVFHPEPFEDENVRHHRLLTRDYLQTLVSLVNPNGKVVIKTDHAEYAAELEATLGAFRVVAHSRDFHRDEKLLKRLAGRIFAGEATTYERRYQRRRTPIHYFELATLES